MTKRGSSGDFARRGEDCADEYVKKDTSNNTRAIKRRKELTCVCVLSEGGEQGGNEGRC